ncbi:unnamed protein product [Withania somnifera]
MAAKVKGLLKGLRYISQIFDEEKEKEIQIGFPTDVKHVAHTGWDGSSTDNPSWMKQFNGAGQFQSAPLVRPPSDIPNDIQWVSQDSNQRSRNLDSASAGDQPEQQKSNRRHSSKANRTTDSPKKARSSRRHHRKDSGDGSKHGRIHLDSAAGTESPKSKESVPGVTIAGTRSAKSKGNSSSTAAAASEGSRNSGSIVS